MLNRLTIKNVALIDNATIDFTSGLNVLSGETGSGKSVILESLNFALGAKADKSLIRSGETECFVCAEFDIDLSKNPEINLLYNDFDIEPENTLIISRKFTVDGKNTIKINGSTATVGMLKRFTSLLVDVHGQSEHFYLLKTANQLELIDKVGGEKVSKIKESLSNVYSEYKKIKTDLGELGGSESDRAIRLDILNFQINEIETADIKENEEFELNEIRAKLINQEKIANALNVVKNSISSEGGVSDVLGNAEKTMGTIADLSDEYNSLYERLSSIYAEIDDISSVASDYADNLDFGDYNPDEIEVRLDQIKKLKKKYGATFDDICEFLSNAKFEREKLENFNELAETLLVRKENCEDELYDLYTKLSNERRTVSKVFAENILSELKELNISKAQFFVKFDDLIERSQCKFDSANGIDNIEFMFSANFGEPVKPLSYVISGGEMSRFMLAIKTQTAKYNSLSTFVFDEIDAGISGVVAKTVSEKFAKISKDTQIIAISHLPQISAMADNNLLIYKTETDQKTNTNVISLGKDEKIDEIVRLSGGVKDSELSRTHAKEIIMAATEFKKSL